MNKMRGRGRGRGRGQSNEYQPRSLKLDDNDFFMHTTRQNRLANRFNKPYYSSRARRPRYRGGFNNRVRDPFSSKWSKISIPGGKNHSKDWLIKKLQSLSEEPFEPVEFHYIGDTASFFTDNADVAKSLKQSSLKITCKDGSKIAIHVRACPPPRNTETRSRTEEPAITRTVLNSETEQVLMACLATRFNSTTKTINLGRLVDDTILTENNVKGQLQQPWLASAFFKLMHDNCQELVGLDLSGNNLWRLEVLRELPNKLPHIEILSLKDNKIRSIDELVKLKNMKSLKKLILEGNPCCNKYQNDHKGYISDVRAQFPKLQMLDGIDLPPPIVFDIPVTTCLPKTLENYVPDPQMQILISAFLQQYYMCYDSDDREGLLNAYHDQATFSMTVNNTPTVRHKNAAPAERIPLNNYYDFSRNLKRVSEKSKWSNVIKNTKLATVAYLNELPKTKHDLTSFLLDISVATASCLCFTIQGKFVEGDTYALRAFARTFIAVPKTGGSLQIINDQLHLRNPSSIGRNVQQLTSPPQLEQKQPSGSEEQVLKSLPIKQQEMLQKFSEDSKMNFKFSYDCLAQNHWNFQKAALTFTTLQADGNIPPEAFIK